MTEATIPTAWMWASQGEVRGLRLDAEAGQLRWYDTIGCHCTDEAYFGQLIGDYLCDGAPAVMGPLPADVEAELAATLAQLR